MRCMRPLYLLQIGSAQQPICEDALRFTCKRKRYATTLERGRTDGLQRSHPAFHSPLLLDFLQARLCRWMKCHDIRRVCVGHMLFNARCMMNNSRVLHSNSESFLHFSVRCAVVSVSSQRPCITVKRIYVVRRPTLGFSKFQRFSWLAGVINVISDQFMISVVS